MIQRLVPDISSFGGVSRAFAVHKFMYGSLLHLNVCKGLSHASCITNLPTLHREKKY